MNQFYNKLFIYYSALIFLPAIYRLVLPPSLGDLSYYIIAFLFPLLIFIYYFINHKINISILYSFLSIISVITISLMLSWMNPSIGHITWFTTIQGFKYYLVPMLIFFAGYQFGGNVDRQKLLNTIIAIFVIQLLFSLIFYYEIIQNPIYNEFSDLYRENWVVTTGEYKAFTGLTLSKFSLAYQVGFIVIFMLLLKDNYNFDRFKYLTVLVIGFIIVVFTFNKTIMVVILITISYLIFKYTKVKSKAIGFTVMLILLTGIVYSGLLFFTGELNLFEIYKFLSPSTFFSRIDRWQEYFQFDLLSILAGKGAGYFDQNNITLDNQFLYTYLEMGLFGFLIYFASFFYFLYYFSPKNYIFRMTVLILLMIFVGGDMLGLPVIMYVIGIYFGQSNQNESLPGKKVKLISHAN